MVHCMNSDDMDVEQFSIRMLKATEEPHVCLLFIRKHREVLKYYGIDMITSNSNSWTDNPNVYVLIAESLTTGEMIGGVRIHIASPEYSLPIEDAVGFMDPKINKLIKEYSSYGKIGEMCGLWNSLQYKRVGLGIRLGRAAIATSNQLKLTKLMAIVGRPTLQSCRNIGYVESEILGDRGTFPYPKKDMVAWTLGVMNPNILKNARPKDKKLILDLRKNPKQLRKELAGRLKLEIDYQLTLKG